MRKIGLIFMMMFLMSANAWAHGSFGQAEITSNATLSAIWLAALITAVVHTIIGPDHYLPFVAIAKSRGYGLKKNIVMDVYLRGWAYCKRAYYCLDVYLFFALVEPRKLFVAGRKSR